MPSSVADPYVAVATVTVGSLCSGSVQMREGAAVMKVLAVAIVLMVVSEVVAWASCVPCVVK